MKVEEEEHIMEADEARTRSNMLRKMSHRQTVQMIKRKKEEGEAMVLEEKDSGSQGVLMTSGAWPPFSILTTPTTRATFSSCSARRTCSSKPSRSPAQSSSMSQRGQYLAPCQASLSAAASQQSGPASATAWRGPWARTWRWNTSPKGWRGSGSDWRRTDRSYPSFSFSSDCSLCPRCPRTGHSTWPVVSSVGYIMTMVF